VDKVAASPSTISGVTLTAKAHDPQFLTVQKNSRARTLRFLTQLTGFKSFVDPTDLIITDVYRRGSPQWLCKSQLSKRSVVMGENRRPRCGARDGDGDFFAGASSRPAKKRLPKSLATTNSNVCPRWLHVRDSIEITDGSPVMSSRRNKAAGKKVASRDVKCFSLNHRLGPPPALCTRSGSRTYQGQTQKPRPHSGRSLAGISGFMHRPATRPSLS